MRIHEEVGVQGHVQGLHEDAQGRQGVVLGCQENAQGCMEVGGCMRKLGGCMGLHKNAEGSHSSPQPLNRLLPLPCWALPLCFPLSALLPWTGPRVAAVPWGGTASPPVVMDATPSPWRHLPPLLLPHLVPMATGIANSFHDTKDLPIGFL